jgi:hypothetical protein
MSQFRQGKTLSKYFGKVKSGLDPNNYIHLESVAITTCQIQVVDYVLMALQSLYLHVFRSVIFNILLRFS